MTWNEVVAGLDVYRRAYQQAIAKTAAELEPRHATGELGGMTDEDGPEACEPLDRLRDELRERFDRSRHEALLVLAASRNEPDELMMAATESEEEHEERLRSAAAEVGANDILECWGCRCS